MQQRLDKELGTVCQQLIQRLQAGSTLHEAMNCDRVFFRRWQLRLLLQVKAAVSWNVFWKRLLNIMHDSMS